MAVKALVISGGGNKGAFAGGIAEYLIEHKKRDYDLFLGTSTGSLLLPLLSVGKVQKIRNVFINTTQKSIFKSSPFIISKNKYGLTSARMNHLNIVKMFLKGKKTLGDSRNLLHLIRNNFLPEDFEALRKSEKKVLVTVANLTRNKVEYKLSEECNYDDFCEWVWISANLAPYMSLVEKDNCEYADGGFGNYLPIKKAIEMGATDIDAIILKTSENLVNNIPGKNVLDIFLRLFGYMINQIAVNDIEMAKILCEKEKVRINYYYIPYVLTDNPLIFDSAQMRNWWHDGFEYARTSKPIIQDERNKFFAIFG